MLKKLYPKARYLWQQPSTRTASENKDKPQNILSQKVIVTKHYANIQGGKDIQLAKGYVKHNVQTAQKAQQYDKKITRQRYGRQTTNQYIVWATQMPNCNTNNTTMKTAV